MNPYLLGFLTGAFFAVLIVTCILYAIAFKWKASYAKSISLNVTSFAIASILSAFGAADGGPLNFKSTPYYFMAQALVLALDLFRVHRKLGKQGGV